MPSDLMIYTLYGLTSLIKRGIVTYLGGQRFQFTRDYSHAPEFNHPVKARLDPIRPTSWSVTSGTIFSIIGMSDVVPYAQKPNMQSHSIIFELGSAYNAYVGQSRYYTADEGNQSPVHNQTIPVAITSGSGKFYTGGDRVGLRGRGYDSDTVVTYTWSQVSGPVVEIINSSSQEAYFIAPYVFTQSILVFRFTVFDGTHTAYSDVAIRVEP